MGSSYFPNLVHILIILGFAEKIKFLAIPEVRPNFTSSSAVNTKDYKGEKRANMHAIYKTNPLQ
jgi:hypothetical protein